MTRIESDREDILQEATALVDRAELRVAWSTAVVVVGFRRQGALSLFIGPDEVYHFNAQRELRRGYWQGRLLKADSGTLVELRRERTADQTTLRRRTLTLDEQQLHVDRLHERFRQLQSTLRLHEEDLIVRSVTQGTVCWTDRLLSWIESQRHVVIADRPNA